MGAYEHDAWCFYHTCRLKSPWLSLTKIRGMWGTGDTWHEPKRCILSCVAKSTDWSGRHSRWALHHSLNLTRVTYEVGTGSFAWCASLVMLSLSRQFFFVTVSVQIQFSLFLNNTEGLDEMIVESFSITYIQKYCVIWTLSICWVNNFFEDKN